MGKVHALKPRVARRATPEPTPVPAVEAGAVFPGSELIRLLLERGDEAGLSPRKLAAAVGVSLSYLAKLSRGPSNKDYRRVQDLSVVQLKKVASFLERPLMDILVLAEIVSPEEQYVAADLKARVNSVWERWRADPVWSRLSPVPSRWHKMDFEDQIRMTVLYDHLMHRTLILPAPHMITFAPASSLRGRRRKRSSAAGIKRAAA